VAEDGEGNDHRLPKDEEAMKSLINWANEWIETWRVTPPFSRRRRELLEAIADNDPENYVEIERPESK
jgi:hypothetical protein